MKPSVKICGICNQRDAMLAVDHGAKYIGLIFVQSSPRYVDSATAHSIAESIAQRAKVVGVFQNHTAKEIDDIVDLVAIDYIQLHGNESPDFCKQLSKPVIKSFQISPVNTSAKQPCLTLSSNYLELLKQYRSYCSHFLFDKVKGQDNDNWLGFAINELKPIQDELGDYFFAGGLHPQNVKSVLDTLNPATLDVASGVEQTTREKSNILIKEFFDSMKDKK